MNLVEFIGKPISSLLGVNPFRSAECHRSKETSIDRPRIDFEFTTLNIDVSCDLSGTIVTIFTRTDRIDGELIISLPFSCSREEVRAEFGQPARSGEKSSSPVIGLSGPWDLFERPAYSIHVEFEVKNDRIKLVTLMQNDVVPRTQAESPKSGRPRKTAG